MLGRKRQRTPDADAVVAAFRTCAARVDAAQRALLEAIPLPRDEGRPLSEAIDGFLEHLAAAEAGMHAWQRPPLAHEWTSCAKALVDAREEADRLRGESELGFETLNGRVGDVIYPLEAFADAARAVRRFGRHG